MLLLVFLNIQSAHGHSLIRWCAQALRMLVTVRLQKRFQRWVMRRRAAGRLSIPRRGEVSCEIQLAHSKKWVIVCLMPRPNCRDQISTQPDLYRLGCAPPLILRCVSFILPPFFVSPHHFFDNCMLFECNREWATANEMRDWKLERACARALWETFSSHFINNVSLFSLLAEVNRGTQFLFR